jgi:diguanylate cyclase (GGDEF)-like protein
MIAGLPVSVPTPTSPPSLADRLATTPLFSRLPPRVRSAVVGRGVVRQLAADDRLLQAGSPNASLFIVIEGAVDVLVRGIPVPLVRLGPGECAGELSLIDGQAVSADVVAALPTLVLELPQREVWALIDSSAVFARNVLRVLAGPVRHDQTVLAESSDARQHYERLAMVDSLTGRHNRRWFDTMFPLQLARLQQDGRSGALLMVDVDHFKALNDVHGHAVGDAVLRRLGAALAAGLRPGDLLARFGGEEFAALVADIDGQALLDVAERLRRQVAAPADDIPPCTVSIGVAAMQPGESFAALVQRADAALFRAKAAGRNRISD